MSIVQGLGKSGTIPQLANGSQEVTMLQECKQQQQQISTTPFCFQVKISGTRNSNIFIIKTLLLNKYSDNIYKKLVAKQNA
eukprot:m.331559 g.331559  ORF g.331559 m.331559 type:complete len:81 (+) comp16753_c0_seq1:1181-1423(+)